MNECDNEMCDKNDSDNEMDNRNVIMRCGMEVKPQKGSIRLAVPGRLSTHA